MQGNKFSLSLQIQKIKLHVQISKNKFQTCNDFYRRLQEYFQTDLQGHKFNGWVCALLHQHLNNSVSI